LEYLELKPAATAPEMAQALHLTAANIRHHLAILASQGVVEVVGARLETSLGRPSRLYARSSRMGQHNLGPLASALLEELASYIPEEKREEHLQRLAARLAAPEAGPPASAARRFGAAVEHLNRQGYSARWEARSSGPRLILGHCPYAAILPTHPELCQLDAHLLETMLSQPVVQAARLEETAAGLRQCVFVAGKESELRENR
jgi:predicted ArsR family transcriptional regulator